MKKFKVKNLYICEIAKYIDKNYKLVKESNNCDLCNVEHMYIIAREVSTMDTTGIFPVPAPTVYEEIFSKAKMSENCGISGENGKYLVYSATPLISNRNKITEIEALNILEDLNSCTEKKQMVKKMHRYGIMY